MLNPERRASAQPLHESYTRLTLTSCSSPSVARNRNSNGWGFLDSHILQRTAYPGTRLNRPLGRDAKPGLMLPATPVHTVDSGTLAGLLALAHPV